MASTTSFPTTTTTGCPRPAASYPFEPTGTFNGTTALPPAWINTPFAPAGLEAPFFPPTKTYSSIFNKDTVVPPTMMPTPVAMPPMAPYTMPVPVPAMTPVTGYPTTWAPSTHFNMPTYAPWATMPRECPVTGVPATWLPWMNTWCPPTTFGPISTLASRPSTVYPSTVFPTVFDRTPELINSWISRINNTVDNLCSIAFRPSNTVELYCLTNPIRICDREGNRILCLNFDLRGYKPEEVIVTLNKAERCIIVEASHEVKEGKEHHVMRKFCRKFVLPESLAKIDLAKCEIKSCLTTEGCLCIEMPLPKLTIEEIAKCPIMSKDYTSAPFGLLSCDYTNTTPIACKIN